MISLVFWLLYAGVCIGSGWIAWSSADQEGRGLAQCIWAAVFSALFAPVLIGVVTSVLLLREVMRT